MDQENRGILTLTEKKHLIDNIWAFRFRPEPTFTWAPGQYIYIQLVHENPDEEGDKRWFTVSSAPFEGFVQITTRVTETTFKQALSKLAVGDSLTLLDPPAGSFVWRETTQPHVLVAGGIGITPFYSILKTRIHDGQEIPATLIYNGRNDNLPFMDELRGWAEEHNEFHIEYVIGEQLTADKIRELGNITDQTGIYLSGPEPMVIALKQSLHESGIDETHLITDEFPGYTQENF